MTETITAREANHNFSRLLRDVAAGKQYLITRSGTPVATLAPVAAAPGLRNLTPEQERALRDLVERSLRNEVAPDAEPARLNRDELYEERIPKRLRDRE